jgi:hypothetical protein
MPSARVRIMPPQISASVAAESGERGTFEVLPSVWGCVILFNQINNLR